MKRKDYWSEVFVSTSTPGEISVAWNEYLTNTYQLSRSAGGTCAEVASRESVKGAHGIEAAMLRQSQQATAAVEMRKSMPPALSRQLPSPASVAEHTAVETQWKYIDPPGQTAGGQIDGDYIASFVCGSSTRSQTVISLKAAHNSLTGVVKVITVTHAELRYSVAGSFDASTGAFHLAPGEWLTASSRPITAPMDTFVGTFNSRTGLLSGRTAKSCGQFAETFEAKPEPLLLEAPEAAERRAAGAGPKRKVVTTQNAAPPIENSGPCYDTAWPLEGVRFSSWGIVHSLFIGHFECIPEQPWQVMSYITGMNESLGKTCPNLRDESISRAAQQAVNARTQGDFLRNLSGANLPGLRIGLESQSVFRDFGEKDAEILLEHSTEKCDSTATKIVQNMGVYVRSPH